jgi:hypothetical protein
MCDPNRYKPVAALTLSVLTLVGDAAEPQKRFTLKVGALRSEAIVNAL